MMELSELILMEGVKEMTESGRLISIRLAYLGWTRKRLAVEVGRTESWLSKIMSGKTQLTVPMLLEIAKVLGVEPGTLLPTSQSGKESFEKYLERKIDERLEQKEKAEGKK